MKIELSDKEIDRLSSALDRMIIHTQREIAATEAFSLQRELSVDISELEALFEKLQKALVQHRSDLLNAQLS